MMMTTFQLRENWRHATEGQIHGQTGGEGAMLNATTQGGLHNKPL